jgi:hypothetical protein
MFNTGSYNVISSDGNSYVDVFVRNISTNQTFRASTSATGVAPNNNSSGAAISETGRYILFNSYATNLIDGTTVSSTNQQLYLRDTKTNTTTLLSQNSSGQVADNAVVGLDISSDGRFVLLSSAATNLGPIITNTGANLFILDRSDNSFTVLNKKDDGTLPTGDVTRAQISCDGSLVVFQTNQHLITSAPGSSHTDSYLLDRRAGNKLTNLTGSTNGAGLDPSISCNGNYIGIFDEATNISVSSGPSGDGNYHAYIYDRIDGSWVIADQSSSGTLGSPGAFNYYDPQNTSYEFSIIDNGIAAFSSTATNLTTTSNGGYQQIYIHKLQTGSTELVTQTSAGAAGNRLSRIPYISNDGKLVSYTSASTNLVTQSDTNNYADAFMSQTGY